MVFIKVIFNEDLELKNLNKENKINSCDNKDYKSYKKIFLEIGSHSKCKSFTSNLSYLLAFTENKYIYYSFALVLGGVLNMKKIVKTGIF